MQKWTYLDCLYLALIQKLMLHSWKYNLYFVYRLTSLVFLFLLQQMENNKDVFTRVT